MADKNANAKQALEKEVKDLYCEFTHDGTVVSGVGIKSISMPVAGVYNIVLQDSFMALKHAKAILKSVATQDLRFQVSQEPTASVPTVRILCLNSSNVVTQPSSGSRILLKLELKNSST